MNDFLGKAAGLIISILFTAGCLYAVYSWGGPVGGAILDAILPFLGTIL